MKKLHIASITIVIVLFFASCQKDAELASREYPFLQTNEVKEIKTTGATFSAVLLTASPKAILDFGFICGDGNNEFKYSIADEKEINDFEMTMTTDLEEGVEYTCRAYVETEDNVVLGNVVSFVALGSSKPALGSFYPQSGFDGTEVTLNGRNFSKILSNNRVFMEEFEAQVTAVSDNSITFRIPESQYLGEVSIYVQVGKLKVKAARYFTVLGPEIDNISANSGYPGEVVRVEGRNFLANGPTVGITIDNVNATVIRYSDNEILFRVPYDKTRLKYGFGGYVLVINNRKKKFSINGYFNVQRSWFDVAWPLLSWHYGSSAFVYNGKGYVLDYYWNSFHCYTPETNRWEQLSGVVVPNQGVHLRAFAVVGNSVYVAGGNFGSTEAVRYVWKFDFLSNTWTRRNDIPFDFLEHTMFELNGKTYLISHKQECWLCDFENDTYSRLSDFPVGFRGEWIGSFVIKGTAYVAKYGRTWRYDEQNDQWLEIGANPLYWGSYNGIPPYFTANDAGYVLIDGNKLFRFDPELDSWSIVSGYPGYVGDSSSKIAFVINQIAYVPCFASSWGSRTAAMYAFRSK